MRYLGPTDRMMSTHLYKSKENIRTQSAFVGLVDDEGRISRQIRLSKELSEEHTVGHVLQDRLVARAIFETNGVSDLVANFGAHFFRYTRGD